jgi:hypothetical protein
MLASANAQRLPEGCKREHVRAIESAKKPETRVWRIQNALAKVRELESTPGDAARARPRRVDLPRALNRMIRASGALIPGCGATVGGSVSRLELEILLTGTFARP